MQKTITVTPLSPEMIETTKMRLAIRLQSVSPDLAKRAESGEFSDFENQEHATPKVELVKLLRAIAKQSTNVKRIADATALAREIMDGQWDDTKEEAETWYQREGKDLLARG
jgi:hypothetical protein